MITPAKGSASKLPATAAALKSINVIINVEKFVDETIKKPISIPGTYVKLESKRKSIKDIPLSMVQGTVEAIDVIVFILVLGGLIGLVGKTKSFDAGLMILAKKTKSREFLVVFCVSLFMCLGGTSCGACCSVVGGSRKWLPLS